MPRACSSRRNVRILTALLLLLEGSPALAARVRCHFTPIDANGNTTLRPGDVSGYEPRPPVLGIQRSVPGPPPGTTFLITFWHNLSSRYVTVPVTLPEGTPTIEHMRNRIIYNYGSYTVGVRFLPDGSVDVIYDSGLLAGW
jgi:hypothetical protein